jgi:hypothetical protein
MTGLIWLATVIRSSQAAARFGRFVDVAGESLKTQWVEVAETRARQKDRTIRDSEEFLTTTSGQRLGGGSFVAAFHVISIPDHTKSWL